MVTINTPTNSGVQGMLYVTEGNLYWAIFQSRKPEADRFTDWSDRGSLPSIRKNRTVRKPPMTVAENAWRPRVAAGGAGGSALSASATGGNSADGHRPTSADTWSAGHGGRP